LFTQVCGFDIRSLREETIRLNNKIAAMEAEKEHKAEAERQADMKTSEILKYPNLMQELDKPTLIRNMHRLRERVNGLDRDKSALEGALHQAKDVITEFVTLKKDHAVLQGAHLEQTKYLQKMQGKIAQISAYQETIKTQEKVITKMQTIVESKLRSKNALPFQTKTVPPNSQIPVPREDPFAVLGGLPDFEALQAQKMNEEALLQARLEVEELTDKVCLRAVWSMTYSVVCWVGARVIACERL
jgi:DNA repair exonuclease SbcCD ATPase subunit